LENAESLWSGVSAGSETRAERAPGITQGYLAAQGFPGVINSLHGVLILAGWMSCQQQEVTAAFVRGAHDPDAQPHSRLAIRSMKSLA
jgi:hypothetical protein